MNGARSLIQTLVDVDVDTCFMNPGTSEMHFVAALDDVPQMHSVLALFEGVATGAADGYARMADRPAATLLHLGPGLGNGLANLHNARKGQVPVVNIVGDHATYHKQYDAQLESDIDTVARNVSSWIRWSAATADVGRDAADAVAAAAGPPGQVATLVLPADISWGEGGVVADASAPTPAAAPDDALLAAAIDALRGDGRCALMVGGTAARAEALVLAASIGEATGAQVLCETFPARIERGAGVPPVDRIAYLAEFAQMQLDGLDHLILLDTKSPVSFFAYPDKASDLVPEGCTVHAVAGPSTDALGALRALAEAVDASGTAALQPATVPDVPTGALTAETVCQALGALLPPDAIVSDEGNTSGLWAPGFTAGSPRHDWLCLTGGAIGDGLPVALGAATACPDRPVICLESDGSAMYTIQALWTMAREGANVTTILLNNSSYAVLNMELNRVGAAGAGPKAKEMLDLHGPTPDFVSISTGMGVPATRATTADELVSQLRAALAEPGPSLIEAIVPPLGM